MLELKILCKNITIHLNTSPYQSSTGIPFPVTLHTRDSEEPLYVPFTNFSTKRQRKEFNRHPQGPHGGLCFRVLPSTAALRGISAPQGLSSQGTERLSRKMPQATDLQVRKLRGARPNTMMNQVLFNKKNLTT